MTTNEDYIIVVYTIPKEIVSEDTVIGDTVEYQIKYSTFEELKNIINGLPLQALASLTKSYRDLNSFARIDDIIQVVYSRSGGIFSIVISTDIVFV